MVLFEVAEMRQSELEARLLLEPWMLLGACHARPGKPSPTTNFGRTQAEPSNLH
jgi:hypothetical protein